MTEITLRISSDAPAWAKEIIPRLRQQGYRALWSEDTNDEHVICWEDSAQGVPNLPTGYRADEVDVSDSGAEGGEATGRWHIRPSVMTPTYWTPERIKALRSDLGCTQPEMAALLGLADARAVWRLEAGRYDASGPVAVSLGRIHRGALDPKTELEAMQKS